MCLVFEKARRAIERAGSQSITLAEFEAHLVPAPQQRRKPSLPVRLLTGLSLSLVQGLSLYVIAAHAGLVSSPVSAAAARASIGTGGELSQWDTAAVQAVQAVWGAGARAVAAAAKRIVNDGAAALAHEIQQKILFLIFGFHEEIHLLEILLLFCKLIIFISIL